MKAMILAAGRGERLRPLTDHTPKPLLEVGGKPLLVHHIERFAQAGITDIVINLSHLGEKIEQHLGNGTTWGVRIRYSYENPVLETGGGIAKVLSWFGTSPFIVVSGDIFTDFPLERLLIEPKGLGHLVLVDNPPHHPKGDYALVEEHILEDGDNLLNFAGIGVYRPELFADCPAGRFSLPLLFKKAFSQRLLTGEHYQGIWHNIGTAEQLQTVNELMLNQSICSF